jgi:hypothetical protein
MKSDTIITTKPVTEARLEENGLEHAQFAPVRCGDFREFRILAL